MPTKTYAVAGMTCQHCVDAVRGELAAVPGVNQVDVDLSSGLVTVEATADVDDSLVAGAVEEAGYSLQT